MKSKSQKHLANKLQNAPKSIRARTIDRAYTGPIDRTRAYTGTLDRITIVRAALENPKYKWRTVNGVAKEAGVDETTARRVIAELGEQVVRSSIPSTTGEDLYTTRRHYRESESFLVRMGAILRNRGA